MPFVPHTPADVESMLASIGAPSLDALFDEIPASLQPPALDGVPPPLAEWEITRLMQARADADGRYLNFIGAGAYEHHVPAAVWQVVTRGEFYSAYTPYQAEASQGTLQLLYEYQSMMAALTGLEVSNASLYDGASALAEAVLMAVRCHKGGRRVLLPRALNPAYRAVAATLACPQGVEFAELPYDPATGATPAEAIDALAGDGLAAVVVAQPNFFGVLEDVDALTQAARRHGALVVAVVNPTALALLKPPGEWGEGGADIAVGDGQPLGLPLAGGGPSLGFMACRKSHVRQMPGRLVGATQDREGGRGYVLTLQAREQHIRRSKATSNICTNQGLAAAAATVYLALVGGDGLRRIAARCHTNVTTLAQRLATVPGMERMFSGPVFHEVAFRLSVPVADVLRSLEAQSILGGAPLAADYPELDGGLLVCATETKTDDDLEHFARHLERILGKGHQTAPCAMKT
jgi:glycine dehydrogenase subunit 1